MRRSLVLLALPSLLTAAHPSVRELSLKTPDGFTLKGTLTVPAGHGRHAAVILAHQFQSRSGRMGTLGRAAPEAWHRHPGPGPQGSWPEHGPQWRKLDGW